MRTSTIALVLAVACSKEEPAAPPPKLEPPKVEAPKPEPPKPDSPKVIRVEGFQTPESILHDEQADVYLVGNINGSPFAKDDNGFISRVTPDGNLAEPAWIDGKSDKVTLHAPKGMALLGDLLYVADIDTVRMFDRKTGEPKGEVAIPKATFLNDLVAGNGVVYASDSGMLEGFKPSGTASVWSITDGKAKQLAKGDELGGPNGLAVAGDGLWVVTFGSGELYRLTADGKREAIVKLPKGALDGIVVLGDGTLLVSSWEAQAVYAGKPEGPFEPKISGVESPADIGWDGKRNALLIPLFLKNAIEIHPWPGK